MWFFWFLNLHFQENSYSWIWFSLMHYFRIECFFRLKSSSSWNIFLLHRIFAYDVRWLDAALYTSLVTFFKVLSEIWISLFAVGILLLPSIQFLSKLITSLNFPVQEIIDWALIALFYFLLSFWGSSMDSSQKSPCWPCSSKNKEAAISSVIISWVSLTSLHF